MDPVSRDAIEFSGEHAGGRELQGISVVVTRLEAESAELVRGLEARGARVLVRPTMAVFPPSDGAPFQQAMARMARYTWMIFTSAQAVSRVMELVPDPADLAGHKIAVVGPQTARAVEARGLRVALRPERSDAAALLAALAPLLGPSDRVFYPRAESVSTDLAAALRSGGIAVDEAIAYRVGPPAGPSDLGDLLAAGEIDWITAYSGSALRHLLEMLADPAAIRRARLASIGPATSRAARDLGLAVHAEAVSPDAEGMVRAIVAAGNAIGPDAV